MPNLHQESENYEEFENEDTGDNDDYPTEPFDAKRVDVGITTPNLGALITRLEHESISSNLSICQLLWGNPCANGACQFYATAS